MQTLVKGLVIGFSIAAPVGPIGLLCLRCTLTHGRLNGFLCGLGAATADACYGAVAALGLSAVSSFLLGMQPWFQLGGGLFLVWLGIATLRARPSAQRSTAPAPGALIAGYFSTLALTLTNPMTILSFLGIFAGLGLGASTAGGAGAAGWLVLGVFLGSAAWWFVLSTAASWLGRRLQHGGLRALNVASGLIITVFGLWQLAQLYFSYGSH